MKKIVSSPVAIEVYFASRYSFTGNRAGFEKPGCPEPFVQSYR